jgi:solute carrier family 25 protein 33/36
VARSEGILALWKGIVPHLVGVVPSRSIYFASYTKLKEVLVSYRGLETPWIHCLSAASAGAITATLTNPIWVVKTRMQLQSSIKGPQTYKNSFQCLYLLISKEGWRGFYKGISASYVGISESTLQWVVYEQLKLKMKDWRGQELGSRKTVLGISVLI